MGSTLFSYRGVSGGWAGWAITHSYVLQWLVFDESERHQEARPDPTVKNGDANGALLKGIEGGEHLVGRRLDNGAAAH